MLWRHWLKVNQKIGRGVKIHRFCEICENVEIGDHTIIGSHSFLGRNVKIGKACRIQSFFFVGHDGADIGDYVFIGPRVTFCNSKRPRAFMQTTLRPITVEKGATIGAGSIILPGIKIGKYAFIGAGSLVVEDVKPYTLVFGSPARFINYIDETALNTVDTESFK